MWPCTAKPNYFPPVSTLHVFSPIIGISAVSEIGRRAFWGKVVSLQVTSRVCFCNRLPPNFMQTHPQFVLPKIPNFLFSTLLTFWKATLDCVELKKKKSKFLIFLSFNFQFCTVLLKYNRLHHDFFYSKSLIFYSFQKKRYCFNGLTLIHQHLYC